MADFKIKIEWKPSEDKDALLRNTTASFLMSVGGEVLTRNRNGWTRKVEDSVIVSTYPLAQWLAYNWWRLGNEFLPVSGGRPDYDWRCAHELGAVDHGYVWPKVLFVSDGDYVNIWSGGIVMPMQSVSYLGRLASVQAVSVRQFQKEAASLINATLARLDGMDTELSELWKIVSEDMRNSKTRNIRRLEAAMGYDPEECPEERLKEVLEYQKKTGASSIREIAPFLRSDERLHDCLREKSKGLDVCLQVDLTDMMLSNTPAESCHHLESIPWQNGVAAARRLRKTCGFGEEAVSNARLLNLLGLANNGLDDYYRLSADCFVSIGKSIGGRQYSFVPRRKRMITGRRFELARLLGDALIFNENKGEWLVASDCKTARQKVQRAFAAEFLCPVEALDDFMGNDYSKEKQRKAAEYFMVSEQTVSSVLMNNGKIEHREPSFPYSMVKNFYNA